MKNPSSQLFWELSQYGYQPSQFTEAVVKACFSLKIIILSLTDTVLSLIWDKIPIRWTHVRYRGWKLHIYSFELLPQGIYFAPLLKKVPIWDGWVFFSQHSCKACLSQHSASPRASKISFALVLRKENWAISHWHFFQRWCKINPQWNNEKL